MEQKPYIQHYLGELDETGLQICILCGEVLIDYRNVHYVLSDGPPKGFKSGEFFILKGQPTIMLSQAPRGEIIEQCVIKL